MIGQKLTLRNVAKHYHATQAVHDIDLGIDAGEFVSIVGPSGSGKTTLLTMIAGFEQPSSGAIFVAGRDVTGLPPHRRNIGMVFQKYALFPHMTVRQNLAFPLKMRRLAKGRDAQARVDAMLDLVQMGDLHGRYPHQLSGGQQQRVAVARALIFDPPVILMDEPLGALDKKLREAMQFEIKRIQERIGATVVYVTHDQHEALTMSDRVCVMHQGRLEQVGRPAELYDNPGNAFVADFIGTVNFVPGTVCGADGSGTVVSIGETACVIVDRPDSAAHSSQVTGSAVRIAVRPEHVSLRPVSAAGTRDIFGTIEAIVFSGAVKTALVRLDAVPGLVLRATLQPAFSPLPEKGGKVAIGFRPGSLKLFAPDEGGLR